MPAVSTFVGLGLTGTILGTTTAAVASAATIGLMVGAVVGGVTAAVTGGNVLKGALLGGLIGGVTGGLGELLGGALGGAASGAEAGAAATESTASAVMDPLTANIVESGGQGFGGGIVDYSGSAVVPSAAPSAAPVAATPSPVTSTTQTPVKPAAGTETMTDKLVTAAVPALIQGTGSAISAREAEKAKKKEMDMLDAARRVNVLNMSRPAQITNTKVAQTQLTPAGGLTSTAAPSSTQVANVGQMVNATQVANTQQINAMDYRNLNPQGAAA